MSYIDELFTRYGSPSKEAEIKLWGYLKRPDTCSSFDDIRHNGETPPVAMSAVWSWEHENMMDCVARVKVLLSELR